MKENSDDLSKLSKILSEKAKEFTSGKEEMYQLCSLVDDLILVWCKEEMCLYAQILQSSYSEHENRTKENHKIQSLFLSKPPIWDVREIILNKSGTGVLLLGNEGVAVVELPKRWGSPHLFEGGMENLTCRVEYVGEQFFTCNPLVKIISADWHPGSMNYSFIVVLSSDNYLRLYNISYLDVPEKAFAVAKSSIYRKESGKFGVGESAVAFGIGPATCATTGQTQLPTNEQYSKVGKTFTEEMEKQKQKYYDLLWPIFILYNNGDVYYILTSLNKSMKKRILYGPLNFLPSSFDNYGVDFCNLLVLPTSPIVVVIANTKGFLHHCVVMDATSNKEKDLDDSLQTEDLSESISQLSLEACNVYIHVYESIHLNLSLSTPSLTITSPIVLKSDPITPSRYWVYHSEGCHGVTVPLVEQLLPLESEFPNSDLESRAEYMLCTRPTASTKSCSVVGLCVSPSSKIFLLLSSGNIETIPMPSTMSPRVPSFYLQGSEEEPSPLRKVYKESFEDHIRSILLRTSSQPLLASGATSDATTEEYLQLLNMVTNTLRGNYIKPQIKAREEIRQRHNILIEQKEHLKRELNVLQNEKKNLTNKAHELAEKYEETNDRQAHIMKRLEVVIGQLVRRMPVLSTSEKGMLKELEEMAEKSKTFQANLNQIHSKQQWHTSQMEKEKENQMLKSQHGSSLSDNQISCLKLSLSKESDKLSSLVKKINQIKKEVGI